MAAGAYGFYKDGVMKIASYRKESSPKSLGYNIYNTLRLSWPQEIQYMFDLIVIVQSSDTPTKEVLEEIYNSIGGSSGYKIKSGTETFEKILGEKQDDIFAYFQDMRHSGLHYMVDGSENVKTYGVCEWVYLYNLDVDKLEVWHKRENPPTEEIIGDNPYIYLSENFDLINSMVHDPNDLGRNQFSLLGMDEAYNIVYGGMY